MMVGNLGSLKSSVSPLPSFENRKPTAPFHFCLLDADRLTPAVVKPKGFGPDGPTMGNMGGLFGRPAIDKPLDVCDILELIAPNVSELQLFKNDVGEVYTLCESLAQCFVFVFFPSRFSLVLRDPIWDDMFYFHPFTLRYFHSPVHSSLPKSHELDEYIESGSSACSTRVILVRSALISTPCDPTDRRFCFALLPSSSRDKSDATAPEVSETKVGDHECSGATVVRSDLQDRRMVFWERVVRGDCRSRVSRWPCFSSFVWHPFPVIK